MKRLKSQNPAMRICHKCGRELSISCFTKAKKYKDGIDTRCRDCTKEYNDAYRTRNPKRSTSWRREWVAKSSPEETEQFYLKNNLQRYGLTVDQYEAKVVAQDNKCAICGQPPAATHRKNRRLFVDHDHTKDADKVKGGDRGVRDLLCHSCNATLGLMRDSPALLRKAADYLERYKTL